MSRATAVLITLGLILPATASGQRVPEVGERVQILTESGRRAFGTVSFLSADAIEITRNGDGTRYFPVNHVREIRVARTVPAQPGAETRRGLKTFLIMSGAGVGLGAITWSPCTATGFLACLMHPDSRGEAALRGGALGAIVGVPVALIVGLTTGASEEWDDAVLPTNGIAEVLMSPKIFPGVIPGGVGVGLYIPVGR